MSGALEDRVAARVGESVRWFGIRADDASGVWVDGCEVTTACFLGDGTTGPSLELMSGERINPDLYEIEEDPRPAAAALLDAALEDADVVVAYRSSARLERRARSAGALLAAVPVSLQRTLEHKPWVDAQVVGLGLPTLGWSPAGTHRSRPQPRSGFVLRGPGGGGGTGMRLVGSLDDVPDDEMASAFLAGGIGVNASGCCFPDGSVTVHLPTVQLIGIDGCTDLRFGYCGNDGAAMEQLRPGASDAVRMMVERIGGWLVELGWLGAFGLDAVVDGDDVRFCEINPRFQGSSNLASRAARADGRPGLHVEHLAAFLGLSPGPGERVGSPGTVDAAQIVVHNTTGTELVRREGEIDVPGWHVEVVPPTGVRVAPGAPLARLCGTGPVTGDGRALIGAAGAATALVHERFRTL